MKMFGKKGIIFGLGAVLIIVGSIFGINYYKWNKVVKAVGGFPWQDGGIITFYNPTCVMASGKCTCQSAPMSCDGFCVGHSMIVYNGQKTGPNSIMCVPSAFVYSGGGTIPRIGGSIIAGGITNMGAMIKVIGISK